MPLTNAEAKALGNLGPSIKGFLGWRKSLLMPSAVVLMLGAAVRVVSTIAIHWEKRYLLYNFYGAERSCGLQSHSSAHRITSRSVCARCPDAPLM